MRINLVFIFILHFSACPDKRQYNDEARLCPLSASVMNRCMNLKKLQADGGKLDTQSVFVNETHTDTHTFCASTGLICMQINLR